MVPVSSGGGSGMGLPGMPMMAGGGSEAQGGLLGNNAGMPLGGVGQLNGTSMLTAEGLPSTSQPIPSGARPSISQMPLQGETSSGPRILLLQSSRCNFRDRCLLSVGALTRFSCG